MNQKKIVYVDMDGVLVNFQSGIDQLDDNTKLQYQDRLDEVPGIFGLMKPVKNALESYKELTKHFDVYILSTAPWENETALPDKLKWIKKHLGMLAYKRVVFTHNKHLNCGDYLIDDRTKNGAAEFRGEHIHFGPNGTYKTWKETLDYLSKKEGLLLNFSN